MSNNRKLFLQLGRIGDILNALPMAWKHWQDTAEKPLFMVAKEFSSVLDGVSYVERMVFDGPFEDVLAALWKARQVTADIAMCQIYGRGFIASNRCSSFARESWFQAGCTVPWGSIPLVIDCRDYHREEALKERVFCLNDSRPVVLLSMLGKSSPFPFSKMVTEAIRSHLGEDYSVIELSQVKADRFYDLLGLFESAHCLVSIDTAHQHLAAACNVPVVPVITRDPTGWHGSPYRKNHVGRFYYDEFPDCIHRLLSAICSARQPQPQIVHAWCDWRTTAAPAETIRRKRVAQESWRHEYAPGNWQPCEMLRQNAHRDGTDVGDPAPVPFIKDLIAHALRHTNRPADIIALTNADVGFTPGLTGSVLDHCSRRGACFTHRRDFDRIEQPFTNEAQVKQGQFYPGTDAFFFTVDWWRQHGHLLGDYLMGREYWDEAFRQLVKYTGGRGIEFGIWHEYHDSLWQQPEQRRTLAGNRHNEAERAKWFSATGWLPEDFRYFSCIESSHLHP